MQGDGNTGLCSKKHQTTTVLLFRPILVIKQQLRMKKKSHLLILSFAFICSTGNAQWVNRYNGTGDFSDQYTDIVTDQSGNSYACGSTVNPGENKDILVVKMNSLGDTLWTNVYNGPGNGIDEATSITVDLNQNVYITGYQRGTNTGTDMVTIKYNASGVIQWIQPYLFGSDESDKGNAIVVDGSGNVYVTGQADTDPSPVNNDDFITIKYNSAGVQQWTVTKNGLGNGTDRTVDMVLDNAGKVIVTGSAFNGADDDYLTISYNASNGATIWEQVADRTHHDRPTGLVIDQNNGNVYVTGRSRNITYDYLTIGYNSAGTQLWQKVYDYIDDDRATAIAINTAGEIYVSGQSDFDPSANFNYNITTVKYSAAGTQLWASNYANNVGLDDIATKMVADNAGNVFITGISDTDPTATVSNDVVFLGYNTNGVNLFQSTYSQTPTSNDQGAAIALDPSNNLVLAGFSEIVPDKNALVRKYSSTGTLSWSVYFDGIGDNSSNSHAVAVDANFNSFIAGYTVEYGTDRNFALQKIDAQGNTVWIKTLDGTSSGSPDEAFGVAVDATGNIFVGGYVKNLTISYDYCVAKYNQAGTLLWMNTYNYPTANESDKAVSLALDNQGNVYLTGKSDSDPSINSNVDFLTVKWNTNGVLQWAQRYNGTGNGTDLANKIVVAPSGNSYVAGKTFNGSNSDYLLIKYNTAGVQQWIYTYDGSGQDEINALVLDNAENCYFTGFSETSLGADTNMVSIKVDASGNEQWVKTISGAGNGTDLGIDIAIDNNQEVVALGTSDSDANGSNFNNDLVVVKYDPSGNVVWNVNYDDNFNSDEKASNIGVDNQNNIFVTGQSNHTGNPALNYDYVTIKYLTDGTQDSVLVYDGTGNAKDVPNGLFINGTEVYVTGGSTNGAQQRDITTVKYFGLPDAGVTSLSLQTEAFLVYPNPTQQSVTIDVSGLYYSNELLMIALTDVSGATVYKTGLNTNKSTIIDCSNFRPGIYFVNAFSPNGTTTSQKLIIQ